MDTLIKRINTAMRENDTALFGKEPKEWLYKTTDEKDILLSALTLLEASTRQIKFLETLIKKHQERIIPGVNANELK